MKLSLKLVIPGLLVLGFHALVLATLGESRWGAFFSDFAQLILGILVAITSLLASRGPDRLARRFWQLTVAAFSIWIMAQVMATYGDLVTVRDFVRWSVNLLFCFWSLPLVMALFLDPEQELKGFDLLLVLDFAQGIIFCVAAYLYFFYIPYHTEHGTDLAYSVWAPYFMGYGIMTGAFLLRSLLTRSKVVRQLFGRMGAFLLFSGIVDCTYYYGPGRGLNPGAWFEILWSVLLLIPLIAAATWRAPEANDSEAQSSEDSHGLVTTRLFPLLFPLLILGMFTRLAQQRITTATVVVLLSFLCSSARLLVTHLRLLKVQDELRREASHDGLTGIWNRTAILDILRRELLRANRDRTTVGIILADADHFKMVNDTQGHAAGDRALQSIAGQITAAIRPYDSAGRYGGEEFLIVAPGCSEQETWELAERIRNSIGNSPTIPKAGAHAVTLSLGIVASTSAPDTETLLNAADKALYEAKRLGRNRVEPRPQSLPSEIALSAQVKT